MLLGFFLIIIEQLKKNAEIHWEVFDMSNGLKQNKPLSVIDT